ncbi:signal peptidase II [Ligilactobacillus saerimneri]|nr:signal peptidase II [Ligilactobacillus saerimneri]
MMKKSLPVAVLIVGMIVALDQWVKAWVQSNIAFNHEQPLIPGVIDLTHIWNFGAAWSSFSGQHLFFVIISVLALGVMAYVFMKKYQNWWYVIGLSLLCGGTLGNFIDRLGRGYVVDMFALRFISFPIFNIADIALTLGVIVILFALLKDDSLA